MQKEIILKILHLVFSNTTYARVLTLTGCCSRVENSAPAARLNRIWTEEVTSQNHLVINDPLPSKSIK